MKSNNGMGSVYEVTSVRISPFCELARWALELNGIAYKEICHAPIWNVPFTWYTGKTPNVPVVKTPDAILQIRPLLEYIDARASDADKLYPSDPAQRRDVDALLKNFFEVLAIAVRLYAYSNMLPNARVTGPMMSCRAPAWEAAFIHTFYQAQMGAMKKVLGITPESTEKARLDILSMFQTVSNRLANGQPYLVGDRLTAADITFAAVTGPILLPPEYDAPMPTLAQVPEGMKATVLAVQQTPAGQFGLRIYRDHRKGS